MSGQIISWLGVILLVIATGFGCSSSTEQAGSLPTKAENEADKGETRTAEAEKESGNGKAKTSATSENDLTEPEAATSPNPPSEPELEPEKKPEPTPEPEYRTWASADSKLNAEDATTRTDDNALLTEAKGFFRDAIRVSSGAVARESGPYKDEMFLIVLAKINVTGEIELPKEIKLTDGGGQKLVWMGVAGSEDNVLISDTFISTTKILHLYPGRIIFAFLVPKEHKKPFTFGFQDEKKGVSIISRRDWVVESLSHPSEEIRSTAAYIIGPENLDSPDLVLPILAERLKQEKNEKVRKHLQRSIDMLKKKEN